jgi:hypothetical protein
VSEAARLGRFGHRMVLRSVGLLLHLRWIATEALSDFRTVFADHFYMASDPGAISIIQIVQLHGKSLLARNSNQVNGLRCAVNSNKNPFDLRIFMAKDMTQFFLCVGKLRSSLLLIEFLLTFSFLCSTRLSSTFFGSD